MAHRVDEAPVFRQEEKDVSMKRRFTVISDNHGDLINKDDEKAFLNFCNDYKPHDRFHAGDNFDFRNLRKGVDPEEELDDPEPDFLAGLVFLDRYRPTVFLLGNHDHRLWRMVGDTRGIVRKYARDGIAQIEGALKAFKCKLLPYDIEGGAYHLGNDAVICHGYATGQQAVKQHVFSYRKKVVMGHVHSNQVVAVPSLGGLFGISIGGIADHDQMGYARQRFATLGWGKGWAYGTWDDKTGATEIHPMFKQGTKWLTTIG